MTGEALFALLGDLDQALVDGAESAPARKRARFRPAAFVAAAACAALAVLAVNMGLFQIGRDTAEDSMSGGQSEADMTSKPEDVNLQFPNAPGSTDGGSTDGGSTGDCAESQGFFAVITALSPELTVAPSEDSPLWGKASRVVLTMTDCAPEEAAMPDGLKTGETVWIACDLDALIRRDETTLEAPAVYGIYRDRASGS